MDGYTFGDGHFPDLLLRVVLRGDLNVFPAFFVTEILNGSDGAHVHGSFDQRFVLTVFVDVVLQKAIRKHHVTILPQLLLQHLFL